MDLLPRAAAYEGRLPAFIRSSRSVAVGPRIFRSLFSSNRSSLKRLAKSLTFQTLLNLADVCLCASILAITLASYVVLRQQEAPRRRWRRLFRDIGLTLNRCPRRVVRSTQAIENRENQSDDHGGNNRSSAKARIHPSSPPQTAPDIRHDHASIQAAKPANVDRDTSCQCYDPN